MFLPETTLDDTKNKLPLEFETNRFKMSRFEDITLKNAVDEAFDEQLYRLMFYVILCCLLILNKIHQSSAFSKY